MSHFVAAALVLLLAGSAVAQTPKTFPPPPRTAWAPVGCRTPDPAGGVLASRGAWRSLHADEVNSDEVAVAYAPAMAADWVAEPLTWNPTGPVFDSAGNVYFAPFQPHDGALVVALDPATGARRWTIPNSTGSPSGSGTPMILEDPDHPGEELLYHARYDRVLAARTDGSVLWEMPTGLTGPPVGGGFGVNYHAGADALLGLTRDGWLYAVDRRTGVTVLPAPYQLPGAPSPAGPPLATPPAIQACAQAELEKLADLRGQPISLAIDVLLGNGVEVANYFSIDAATGRIWVAATAPDGDDGSVDGVSQLGALYGLDLVPSGPEWQVVEACRQTFTGGSATTPALRRDGTRVYVGDNVGNLIALDRDCRIAWTVNVGGQITGSIGVAADNGEIYASTGGTIHQVIDEGAAGRLAWSANLDVYDLLPGQQVANQTVAGIGANAVSFQAAAVVPLGASRLSITTGVGLLDRLTGEVTAFTPGLDESVAVMSTSPDGTLYMGNSPLRRLFTYCLAEAGLLTIPVAPPIGGIRKFRSVRPDLLLRDAACAAADRARNAQRHRRRCPASAGRRRAAPHPGRAEPARRQRRPPAACLGRQGHVRSSSGASAARASVSPRASSPRRRCARPAGRRRASRRPDPRSRARATARRPRSARAAGASGPCCARCAAAWRRTRCGAAS
ncbi:MAG: PQQ-binding-like beta-propeller repeat protein [bacterium]|nr:PQQ-binding-like beta-propeller repeat protein [bacterium]